MAFATLNMKHRQNQNMKKAPVGFSWTVFFFGFWPPAFRGDWKWFIIMLIATFITFGLSNFVFMFIYNKLHLNSLIDSGYAAADSKDVLAPIEMKLGIKIPSIEG
tara:strand:+ start:861 stop:1175 length:315 start_codon:yes stop_codon:yes gene_type:complete